MTHIFSPIILDHANGWLGHSPNFPGIPSIFDGTRDAPDLCSSYESIYRTVNLQVLNGSSEIVFRDPHFLGNIFSGTPELLMVFPGSCRILHDSCGIGSIMFFPDFYPVGRTGTL